MPLQQLLLQLHYLKMAVQAEDQKAKAEREKAEEKGKQGERLL